MTNREKRLLFLTLFYMLSILWIAFKGKLLPFQAEDVSDHIKNLQQYADILAGFQNT